MYKEKLKIIFLFVLVFISTFFIVRVFFCCDKEEVYMQGWNEAKTRFYNNRNFETKIENQDVRSIFGEIEKIEENKVYLRIKPIDPFDDKDLDVRIVNVVNESNIKRSIPKDEEIFRDELEDFYKKNPEFVGAPDAIGIPSKSEYKKVNFQNLNIGMKLKVTSEENVRMKKEFFAKEIIVLQ